MPCLLKAGRAFDFSHPLCYDWAMDHDIREEVHETLELAQENNRILRSIQRARLWGTVLSVLKWVIIVGSSIGLYYYFEPQINGIMDAWNLAIEMIGNTKGQLNAINSAIAPR